MAISTIKVVFQVNIETLWNTVVNLKEYAWRSDLGRIEIQEENKVFVEYTKDGYPTTFTITKFELYKRYEFDIDNGNMSGHFSGIFTPCKDGVEVTFCEEVTPKKFIMKPFVKMYLKKQQTTYMEDLKKEIIK